MLLPVTPARAGCILGKRKTGTALPQLRRTRAMRLPRAHSDVAALDDGNVNDDDDTAQDGNINADDNAIMDGDECRRIVEHEANFSSSSTSPSSLSTASSSGSPTSCVTSSISSMSSSPSSSKSSMTSYLLNSARARADESSIDVSSRRDDEERCGCSLIVSSVRVRSASDVASERNNTHRSIRKYTRALFNSTTTTWWTRAVVRDIYTLRRRI